jgi:hypothetical protein
MAVTSCLRPGCGRRLRSARSVAAGYSLRCERLERAERTEQALRIVTAPYSGRQVDDASALIASGKQTRTSRPGPWATESSDGTTAYLTSANGCTCPSRKPCKHMCAVAMRETYEAYRKVAA